MRQFIYKMVIFAITIVLIYEFTIGKQVAQLKDKTNTVTKQRYTQRDVSLALSIPPEFFLAVRENSCMKLITVDMIKNPHMYIVNNKTTIYAKSA